MLDYVLSESYYNAESSFYTIISESVKSETPDVMLQYV